MYLTKSSLGKKTVHHMQIYILHFILCILFVYNLIHVPGDSQYVLNRVHLLHWLPNSVLMLYLEKNVCLTTPIKLLWQTDYFAVIYIFIINRETNLKCRQPLPETGELGDDEEQLSQVNSESLCLPQLLHGHLLSTVVIK